MLTITIFDVAGRVVSETTTDAATASEIEINEIIRVVETGMPAWLAAQIVMGGSPALTSQDRGTA